MKLHPYFSGKTVPKLEARKVHHPVNPELNGININADGQWSSGTNNNDNRETDRAVRLAALCKH